ncbi:DNA modification methylase (COG0863) [uncultured Mediterranean phage uvMED]|nr:DNA modification methylase (COG0863) [uncultured Mediterranean phage uvMED]
MIDLRKGDCLIESDKIESGSVDLILTDLPYGTMTKLNYKEQIQYRGENSFKWDEVIDTKKVYEIANRILRKNGKMVLFSQQPFTNELINKAIPNIPFSYSMIWEKDNYGHALLAKKAPLNYYEDILVFSKSMRNEKVYHPIKDYIKQKLEENNLNHNSIEILQCLVDNGITKNLKTAKGVSGHKLNYNTAQFEFITEKHYNILKPLLNWCKPYNELKEIDNEFKNKFPSTFNLWEGNKYKSNILKYKKDYDGNHPTQKPVLLLEDLIKTFSNENDLVVDLTMGSGSTMVACQNTNRNGIGIEMNENYFKIAEQRIKENEYKLF